MPALVKWTKDFKGFMWTELEIGNIAAPATPIQYSEWFDFSDFAMPFDEFTFILNYKNVEIGSSTQKVGVEVAVEWDINIDDTTDITTDIELTGDEMITNWPNATQSMHVNVLDKDISDTAGVNIALARRFRFKMTFSVLAGQSYTDRDTMHLAIVPHSGG